MLARVKSCTLTGLEGHIVDVEADLSPGLPGFDIVGLPDAAVKEAKERVRSAIRNSSFSFPSKRIVVNLAPADIKKEGPSFDLAIAIAILLGMGELKQEQCQDCAFLGELSLGGELRPVGAVLPEVWHLAEQGIAQAFVPKDNAFEASMVQGITVYGADNLYEVFAHLSGEKELEPTTTDVHQLFAKRKGYAVDYSQVKGNHRAKRALEIAAAGGHNLLMIGSPGAGKTMLAQRLPTILPDMTLEEALETTKIHSVVGLLTPEQPLITERPFRAPHHSASTVSLAGGGSNVRPGEISLAHNGVLFLDELPEFKKDALEILRQPLEDGSVTIARAAATHQYPADCMLVAALNPCKCGWYGDKTHRCTCSEAEVSRYLSKISGPLLDRIDLRVEVAPISYREMQEEEGEPSSAIRARVEAARRIQKKRGTINARLSQDALEEVCRLGEEEKQLLEQAFAQMQLSARGYNRILKVARTIADLAGSETVAAFHLAEAISYRGMGKYWENL